MTARDAARVDIGAMLEAAGRYDAMADLLDGTVRARLDRLTFGGASAGRAHMADGDAVRGAIDGIGAQATTWQRACVELAAAIRASADRYLAAESRGAVRLG